MPRREAPGQAWPRVQSLSPQPCPPSGCRAEHLVREPAGIPGLSRFLSGTGLSLQSPSLLPALHFVSALGHVLGLTQTTGGLAGTARVLGCGDPAPWPRSQKDVGVSPSHHLNSVGPWYRSLTSPSLSFLIHERGVTIVLATETSEDSMK